MNSRLEAVEYMTDVMAKFVGYSGKVLPDDVSQKLKALRTQETEELPKTIYDTMFRNQELASALNRPCCQDTGVLQYLVKFGTRFPVIDFIETLLKDATVRATFDAPLRHNSVDTFDEYNTGKNVGKGTPTVFWEIVPECDACEIYTYMAGGGCSLPGKAMVLMPGQGYEGITKFVLDVMTSYGLNACPLLLVGVGVAADSVEEIERADWLDMGMPETLWTCKVKEFGPLIVSIDTYGRNLFEENKVKFNKKKDMVYDSYK